VTVDSCEPEQDALCAYEQAEERRQAIIENVTLERP
jgi:hypothetical protein